MVNEIPTYAYDAFDLGVRRYVGVCVGTYLEKEERRPVEFKEEVQKKHRVLEEHLSYQGLLFFDLQ